MASYDGSFTFKPEHLPLVQALADASRRRARKLSIRQWRCRINPEGDAYFLVDGQTYRLDLFLERLRRDLPTIAEGIARVETPERRRRLANGFTHILISWRVNAYDHRPADYKPHLRALSTSQSLPTHLLWPPNHEDLQLRLALTENIILSWLLDEVEPEVVLEELHTATELLIRRGLRAADRAKYSDMVKDAGRSGLLPPDPMRGFYAPTKPDITMRELLRLLGVARNESKHAGRGATREWLNTHFWAVASALEYLAGRV